MIDHSNLRAWALCWPADPEPLLCNSAEVAEEERKWFSENYKTDKNGNHPGEPFVLELQVKRH